MDSMTAEMLKARGKVTVQWLCQICNQVWSLGVVPQYWKDGAVICIHEKGNLVEYENWRG